MTMKTAKLFMNGRSQAVRIPKEFRMKGKEVFIRKIGNAIIILPKNDPWTLFASALGQFSDDFMADRNQPQQQVRDIDL